MKLLTLRKFLFAILLLRAVSSLAAAGDDCSTAILVSSNGCSAAGAYNNTGITGTLAPPSCFTGGNNNGMWFTFTAASPTVIVTVNGGTLTQIQAALLEPAALPCTGPFTERGCASVTTAPATITYSALTVGNTYYIYVDGRNNQVGTFQLCLSSPIQPGNDSPCSPYVVPATNFCSGINAYTNAGATADNPFSVSFPPCWNSTGTFNTVWFRFTAVGSYNTITVSGTGPSGIVQPQVAVISMGSCNGTTWSNSGASSCGSATAGNNSITINANNLVPGTTYYLAVDGVGNNTGAFQLCINSYTPSATPVNDLCSGAIPLCPGGYYTGTTLNATNTGDPQINQWNCNAVVDNAVWYSFVTTNPVQPINFNITAICNADLLQFEVFDHTGSGTICSNTTGDVSVGCTTFGPTGNGSLTLAAGSLSPSRTYYVVIDNWPGDNCGFNFSISGNAGANAGADLTICEDAAPTTLVGTPAGGVWSGPGITNGASGTFDPDVTGVGTFTVFYTNGACVDQKIINVTGPQVVVSNPVTICQGESTTLHGTITPFPATTTQTFTNTTDYAIPDGTGVPANSPITVSGITPTTVAANPIVSVCLDITHTWDSDIDIYLQCPGGTQILLATAAGGSGDNFTGTCFVTGASAISGGSAPFTGSYAPQNPFTGLNGCNVNGTWNLRVADFVSGDAGIIRDWSISFTNNNTITSYSWTPTTNMTGSNTLSPTVTPTITTTYTLEADDQNGCSGEDHVTITVIPKPNAGPDQSLPCFSSGFVTMAGTGTGTWSAMAGNPGTATITSNTNPTTTITTFSATGTYYFIWTNGGCTDTVAVVAGNSCGCVNPPTIALNATSNTICAGATKTITGTFGGGATQVSASGSGTGSFGTTTASSSPFSFTYTPSAADILAGSVTFTFTTNNPLGSPCVPATTTFVLTISPLPTPSASNTGSYCVGGAIQLNASGGTSYAWSGPNAFANATQNPSTAGATAAMAGIYTVTVTNAASCTATAATTVVVNALPVPSASNTGPYCAGVAIQLNSSGGTSYAWSGPNAYANATQNPSIAGATAAMAGTYTVTVTNAASCTATAATTVVVNALPVPSASNTGPYCAGATAQLNVAGGTTYTWSGPNAFASASQNPAIPNVATSVSGTYTVTATDANGCSGTASTIIVVNPLPIPVASNTGPYCAGVAIQLNSSGGSSYAWSGPNAFANATQSPSIAGATAAMAGTYTVTVTNAASCTATAATTVVVNALPVPSTSNTGPYCAGVTIQLNSSGGSSYAWSGPNAYANATQNPSIAGATAAMAGTYTVTATDGNGCTATAATTVVVNALPVPSASNTGPYCAGTAIQLNSSGGTSYAWSGPNAYANATQNPSIAGATAAMAGTYTVTVTNAASCTATAATTVVVNALPVPSASNTGPYCAGVAIQLNSSGGTSYAWSGPNAYANTTQNPSIAGATAAMAGTYTLTVTDANGCSATAATTVVVNALPVPSASNTGPYCAGVAIQLNSSGGTSYAWSGPNAYANATQNPSIAGATAAMAGTYTVTVTDANGCSATAATTVVVNALPVPSASNTGPYCAGVAIQLNSSGGTSYAWSGPNAYANATQNPSIAGATAAMAGTYTVTVTSAASCTATAATTVVVNALPVPSASNTGPYCAASSIQLNATGGVSYSWNGPVAFASASQNPIRANATLAMAGTYTVTATDANGCSATASTIVVINSSLTPVASNTGPYCAGATAQLNVAGGTTYTWSGPNAFASASQNPAIPNVATSVSGTYTVTATDANGCSGTASTIIVVNPLPIPVASNTGPYCAGVAIQLNSSGGSSYAWSGPNAFANATQSPSIAGATAAMAGTYTVTVTNAASCTATAATTVVVNALPVPSTSNTGPYCAGVTIQLNSSGGSSYAWSGPNAYANATQNPSIAGATAAMAGTYTVTATDGNGCTATAATTVVVNALPVPSASNTGPYCAGTAIQLNSSGGTSYAWSGPNAYANATQNPSIAGATAAMAGTYTVTVTNAASCTATAATTVVVNALPIADAGADVTITCSILQPSLNGAPISLGETYLWSGPGIVSGNSTASPTVNSNGNYTLLVTDANNCTAFDNTFVTSSLNAPNANAGPDDILNCAITSVTLNASSTTPGVTFAWSNGINTAANAVSLANTYTVTVTDPSNGCTASDNVLVTSNTTPPNANAGPDDLLTCAITSVTLTASSTTAGVTFAWSNGINIASNTVSLANTYTVTVTDPSNGCTASDNAIVTANTLAPNANAGPDDLLTCAITSVTLNASSTTAGATFAWSNGINIAANTVSLANTYTVTVTDPSNGCTASDIAVVASNITPPNANAGSDQILSCVITSIQLAGSSSTAGVTYSWSGAGIISGANTATPLVNITGTYVLLVTDPNNGCTATDAADVSPDLNAPNANAGPDDILNCSITSVTLNASSTTPGVTFAWSNGINTAANAVSVANTYTVTVTDPSNGCTASDNAVVTSNTIAPNANAGPDDLLTCAITSVTLTASSTTAGVTFAWSNGINIASNTVSLANTYTVTVTDPSNGCTASDNAIVTSNTLAPNANAGPDDLLTCAITSVTLNASSTTAGATFAWSNGINIAANTVSLANTYTVTVTDPSNGCTASDIAVVASNITPPNANAGSDQILSCVITSIQLAGSSSTAGVTYSWSGAGIISGANTATPLVNITGTYVLLVTDPNNGCTATDAADVSPDLNAPNANAGPDDILNCSITSVTLNASSTTPGVTFAWSNGINIAANTVSVANTYTVTVTDPSNGCTASDNAVVTSNTTPPNANAGPDDLLTCAITSVTLTASSTTPGVTFAWSNGINIAANTVSLANTYTVTVTDPSNGCTASDIAVVASNTTPPNTNAGPDALLTCAITSVTLTASSTTPGVTFAWSNGINIAANPVSLANTYTVTVTDPSNGCTASGIAVVASNITPPNANAGPDALLTCAITSVSLTASSTTTGVSYLWSNGINTATNVVSLVNSYSVTITDPINGCTASDDAVVTEDITAPNANAGPDAILTCAVTSLTLTASSTTNGVSFSWSNGSSTANTIINNSNTYTVTVTNTSNGCTASDQAVVSSNTTPPNANAGPDAVLTCAITSVTLTASSTTSGVSFLWSNGANTAINSVSVVNTYTVTVTDIVNGCTATDQAVVTADLTPPNANAGPDKIISCTMNGINLDGSSTTINAVYLWSGAGVISGATTASAFVNLVGTYTLLVTDPANGCTASDATNVTDPNALTLNTTITNNPCAQLAIGRIDLQVNGGFTPYAYLWSNSAVTEDIANLQGGQYSVTVTDIKGCTISDSYTITEGIFHVNAEHSTTINLGETVQLTGTTIGGSGQETYIWSPDYHLTCTDCTNPVSTPYTDIIYVLKATDTTGCIDYDTVKINVIPIHDIFIPNVFTPNGDGNNDYFEVFGNKKAWKQFEVQVFNRWGEKMYESNDMNFKWDGVFKSNDAPMAVYVYQIWVVYMDNYVDQLYKGSVTLVR